MLYLADNDDMTPPIFWFNPLDTGSYPSSFGFHYYPLLMLPYTNNEELFICPHDRAEDPLLMDSDGRGRFDKKNAFYYYIMGANPSYGYNYRYMNTLRFGGMSHGRPKSVFAGVSATSFNSPSETIMFAEATMKDKTAPGLSGGYGLVKNPIGYSRIEPPHAVPVPPEFPPHSGWTGSFPDARSQGQLWGRFDERRVLVTWSDGHVSFPHINELVGEGTTEREVNRYWNGCGTNCD
jgi:hypothetical protein